MALAHRIVEELRATQRAIRGRPEPIGHGKSAYESVMKSRQAEIDRIEKSIQYISEESDLIGSPDAHFSKYWDNYRWRKDEALRSTEVIDLGDEVITDYDLLINDLRDNLTQAVRRIRGG